MVSLYARSWEKESRMVEAEEDVEEEEEEEEEEEVDEDEDGGEASVTGDDSEPESDMEPDRSLVARRKVSFADAFGLDLVSVKEFDAATDLSDAGVNHDVPLSGKVTPPHAHAKAQADNQLSCLFSVPSGPEELRQRLREQKVELESIELLPGTATLRGMVRVVNLCYWKSVYVRISPDAWRSHFELPATYVPGSSDRETDRFAFIYALVPPVQGEGGTRVEFCLRYETEVGTFWANNRGLNFVLFCHQKAHTEGNRNESEPEEGRNLGHRYVHQKGNKRSCLKANRRGDAEDRTCEVTDKATTTVSEVLVLLKAETASRKKADSTETQLLDGNLLADSMSRRKAARLSHVKDPHCKRHQPTQPPLQAPPDLRHHLLHQHHHSTLVPGGISNGAAITLPRQKQPAEGPQALPTYHQIPLLTLDWRSDNSTPATAEVEAPWRGRGIHNFLSKPSMEGEPPPSAGSPKQAFINGKDECRVEDGSTSVCDIWQSFIDGDGDHNDHSVVPESVWLQRATSISPLGPPAAAANPLQMHTDIQAHSRTHKHPVVSEGQPVSVSHRAGPAVLAASQERQPAGGSRDTKLKPEGSSMTDSQEWAPSLATKTTTAMTTTTPVENDSSEDGSGTQWPRYVPSETRDAEGIRAQKGGGGDGGEPLRAPTGDWITSSGERGTTDMTAAAESQNASDVDRISRGAGPDEGLSQSRGKEEEEVTGSVRAAEYDTLAFREAFKGQGTKDGTGLVLFPFRRGGSGGVGGGGGVEEGRLTMCDTEGEGYTGEEIFRPQDTVNTECSQREAGDKDCEGFRPNKESRTALKHDKTHNGEAGPHMDAFNMDELSVYDTKSTQSQMNANHFKHDMSALSDTTPKDTFQRKERKVEGLQLGTIIDGGLRQKGVEVEINPEIEEEQEQEEQEGGKSLPNNENSFETDLGKETKDLPLMYSEAHEHRLDPIARDKELHIQSETEEPGLEVLTTDKISTAPGSSKSSRKEEGTSESNDVKPSTIKQELCGEMNMDNTQIKYTSLLMQGVVLSDNPSLKGLKGEAGTKRDKGKGEEIKQFQTDDRKFGPLDAVDLKCKKEAQKYLKSEKDDGKACGGITAADDIFRKTLAATSDVSRDLRHPPESSEVEEADGDEEQGIEKGQMEAITEEWQMEEKRPGERKGREVSLQVDGSPQEELQSGKEDDIVAGEIVSFECIVQPGAKVSIFAGEIGQESDKGVLEEVLNWKGVVCGSEYMKGVSGNVPAGVMEEKLTSDVFSATNSPEDPKFLTTVHQGIGYSLVTNEDHATESRELANSVEIVGFSELRQDPHPPAYVKQHLHQVSLKENNEPEMTQSRQSLAKTTQTHQSPDPNSILEENGLFTEPRVSPRFRQTRARPMEKNMKTRNKPKDRSDPYQDPCSQLEDLKVGHHEKFNQSTAQFQDRRNASLQKRWCSAFYPLSHMTKTQVWVILVVLFFIAILLYGFPELLVLYILSLCLYYFQWRRRQWSTMVEVSA